MNRYIGFVNTVLTPVLKKPFWEIPTKIDKGLFLSKLESKLDCDVGDAYN
jgi:hypothetical protein